MKIFYKFHDITGKGFCTVSPEIDFNRYETIEFNVKDVKMLRAGRFIAKGAVLKINGIEAFPEQFDIVFETASTQPIGIALTGGIEGDSIKVCTDGISTYGIDSYTASDGKCWNCECWNAYDYRWTDDICRHCGAKQN